jgi:hypothetical protein
VAAAPPHLRHDLRHDIGAIMQSIQLGVCASRAAASDSTFRRWTEFCSALYIDPLLSDIEDPVLILLLFAHRYRSGQIAPNKSKVRGRTVGDAVRAVGQTLASMGLPDPRLLPSGKLTFRLSRLLASYTRSDPPPTRVKPIPVPILLHTCNRARQTHMPIQIAIADMITLGFYFLLRPGEYAQTSNPDSTPFRLADVHLLRHSIRLDHISCDLDTLYTTTYVGFEFTNKKNGVRGEIIGLGRSQHPAFCPVLATISRVMHLRTHHAALSTPLYMVHSNSQWTPITTTTLTSALRQAVMVLGPTFGITHSDISVRSLRSSGAMALLCADIDTDRIRLLGRWRSDEMLRYLHVQAFPLVQHLAPLMLQHGAFSFLPSTPAPILSPQGRLGE